MEIELVAPMQIVDRGASWPSLIGAWLAEVERRTGSKRTPQEYGRYLRRFVDEALAGNLAALPETTSGIVHDFAYAPGPSGKQPSASTVTVRLAALRSFFDFLWRRELIDRNPVDRVRRPKASAPLPKGLGADELRGLLDAIPSSDSGRRDRAAILLMVFAGLRRAEAFALRAGDLDREDGRTFYTVKVKGGATRRRELPAPALAAIEAYWSSRGSSLDALEASAPLFPVSAATFYDNLARYAQRAGIDKISPHALRHSAAKLRRQSGATIEDVQTLLGHKSISTTAIYLQRLEGARDDGWHGVASALGVS